MRLITVIHILYEYAESCTVVVQGHKKSRGLTAPALPSIGSSKPS